MRILALDVGDRRIGVAVSDPTGSIATPLAVIQRSGDENDFTAVLEHARQQGAQRMLVGLPISLSGRLHGQARAVQLFVAALKSRSTVPVETLDERFTTVQAERRMQEAGLSAQKRKALRDAAAAAILLQGYLDRQPRL